MKSETCPEKLLLAQWEAVDLKIKKNNPTKLIMSSVVQGLRNEHLKGEDSGKEQFCMFELSGGHCH